MDSNGCIGHRLKGSSLISSWFLMFREVENRGD